MLLASDFDNTLYIDDESIVMENITAINEFMDNGNLFAIITGRCISSVKELINKYNIRYDYLICENGAMIFDNNDNLISSCYLNKSDINSIEKIVTENSIDYVVDTGYNLTDNFNEENVACIFLDKNSFSYPLEVLDLVNSNTSTYSYISPNWINIVNKYVNKGNALLFLQHKYNFNIKSIGDAINDISMIEEFSGGVMRIHEKELDELPNKNYSTLADYIKELI